MRTNPNRFPKTATLKFMLEYDAQEDCLKWKHRWQPGEYGYEYSTPKPKKYGKRADKGGSVDFGYESYSAKKIIAALTK